MTTLQNNEIAIVHGIVHDLDDVTEIIFRNHANYALEHGYLLQEWKIKPKKVGDSLWALYETFKQNPDIRRAFWINADAIFTNLELTLTDHLPQGKFVMAYDIFGPSADCLWVENCPEVCRLLWAASCVGEWIFEGNYPGTGNRPGTISFKEMMGLRYLSLHPPYQELFTYVEQRMMKSHSSYCSDGRPDDSFGKWQEGDFILSLGDTPEPFRMAALEKVLPLD